MCQPMSGSEPMLHGNRLKILILGLNYAPEMVGIAIYTAGLAEDLTRRGHDVRVLAGKPYYPGWKIPTDYKNFWLRRTKENGVELTRIAHYVPGNPTGLRRILHHLSFAASSLFPFLYWSFKQKPDVILTVAPSLIAAPVAWLAARLTGAKAWLHIQDFEVEAAMATGLVGRAGLGARLARLFEASILRRFDRVSSISPAMCRKCAEKGVEPDRVVEFRNWADIDAIRPLEVPSPYREEWGVSTPNVALYSGNIGNKQGIEIVVRAARRLRHCKDLTFVICGEGPNRSNLEVQAADLGNILFRDLQPTERLGDLLGMATMHLLPQLGGAADLVLPSKLSNMLASGRPVVASARQSSDLADEVRGCGVVIPPEDVTAFAGAIELLCDHEAARTAFGRAARERAERRWRRDVIIDGFERAIAQCIGKHASVGFSAEKYSAE